MKINGKKSESEIMAELERETAGRDRQFVIQQLEKAEKNLNKAEQNWQDSGGYGSRAPINRWSDQERLCQIALKAVNSTCEKCTRRNKRIRELIEQLETMQRSGCENISIERALNMLGSVWL